MKVCDALVESLVEAGIDTVFGIPGGITLALNHAIDRHDDLRYVMARHETAVTHQAWGYAESSGRPAATLVVPGPGDMNALNGLQNALNDCNPLIHVAAEISPETRGGDDIHEAPPETYDEVVKENVTISSPASAVAEFRRAIRVALTPPRGPVRVGIPTTFLEADAPHTGSTSLEVDFDVEVPAEEVAHAAELLAGAEKPVVVAGGGVRESSAAAELRAVAERLDAPVVSTRKGKGAFPADHDLFTGVLTVAGSEALVECIAESDVALAVGTDLDALTTQKWSYDLPDRLVHVTLHERDLGVGYDPEIGIVADARATLQAIQSALPDRSVRSRGGVERAREVREFERDALSDLLADDEPPISSVRALAAIRGVLARDAIVTVDASGGGLWADTYFPAYDPRDYINQGSWATMGTGLPTALGAKAANPDRDVVAICGDGGLLMAVHEFHTAVSEDLPIVAVVFNNNDFAIISNRGEGRYGMDRFDWQRTPVSFTTVAEGMGMDATRAETPTEIEAALETALQSGAPTLIEVPTDPLEPQVGSLFHTFG